MGWAGRDYIFILAWAGAALAALSQLLQAAAGLAALSAQQLPPEVVQAQLERRRAAAAPRRRAMFFMAGWFVGRFCSDGAAEMPGPRGELSAVLRGRAALFSGGRGGGGRVPEFADADDREGAAREGIDFDEGAAKEGGAGGDGEAGGQGGDEAAQHGGDVAADNAFGGAAHAGVGEVGGAAGEDGFVGGLDVGVGADDGGDAAVEEAAHGDFFAGGFSVEVEKDDGGFLAEGGDFGVEGEKGVFRGRVREGAAHGAGDGDFSFVGVEDDAALAGGAWGEVEGAEQAGLGGHVGDELVLIPAVVAEGDDGGAGAEEADAEARGEAAAGGGIFTIDDDKVGLKAFFEFWQEVGDGAAPGFAKDVAQEENPQGSGDRHIQ